MESLPLHIHIVDLIRKGLFYGIGAFVILLIIPATREMFLKFVGEVGGETAARVFNTVIYMFKEIFRAHLTVLWHLLKSRKQVFLSPDEENIGGANKEKIKS